MTETLYVHAGHLIDGTGAPCRRDVVLEVRGSRVLRVDPVRYAPRPEYAPLLDLSGCTVIPGLVDSHVHLVMSGAADPAVRETQLLADYGQASPGIRERVARHLAHGVTAVRDGGDRRSMALRYRNEHALSSDGHVTLRCAGRAWHAPDRYGKLIGRRPGPAGLAAEVADACARPDGPDHVKIVGSGLNSLIHFGRQTTPQFDQRELSAAVLAARAAGRGTMVHVNGEGPVRTAVLAGAASIEHGFFMGRENLALMADRSVFWCPTACTMQAYAQTLAPGSSHAKVALRTLEHQLEQMALARELCVTTVTGTDSGSLGVHHGRSLRMEMGLFVRAGYSLEQAVRSATTLGAELLGLPEAARGLVSGGTATLVAAPGSPRELIASLAAPRLVMVEGAIVREGRETDIEP
ncbi:MAG: amidohydrolase family protein [Desulfatibacillaceae bacterium]